MNPSGPPIQQIKDSMRATWMAGDFLAQAPQPPAAGRTRAVPSRTQFLHNLEGEPR
jgi:hypothetical protein